MNQSENCCDPLLYVKNYPQPVAFVVGIFNGHLRVQTFLAEENRK